MNDFLLNTCEIRDSALMASFEAENREFTFGQMNEEAVKFAAGLLAMGVKKGDRVAIWGPNQSEWLITVGRILINIFILVNSQEGAQEHCPLFLFSRIQY